MSTYLLINVLIIAIPLLFSFERKVQFFRRLPSILTSIVVVGIPYIIWDVAATARGDWAFNSEYVHNLRIAGLPIEEILFFVTVPYACIFIYETLRAYIPDRSLNFSYWIPAILAVACIIISIVYSHQEYTKTVLLFTGAFFILSTLFHLSLIRSKLFWLFIVISFIPFLIVNYTLTSLPVVTYGEEAFSGIRITTIPFEDFIYSFSLLAFSVLIYRLTLDRWQPHLK